MVVGGFRLSAWITMNNNNNQYRDGLQGNHIHSRMYFTKEDCALIVMFEYTQHEGCLVDDTFSNDFVAGWRVEIWYQYDIKKYLERLRLYCDVGDDHPGFDFVEHYTNHTHLGSSIFTYAGSNHSRHCAFNQTTRSFSAEVILDPVYVYLPAVLLLADIGRFCDIYFHILDLNEFAPTSDFPGCEDWFFSRFPNDIVRLIERVGV